MRELFKSTVAEYYRQRAGFFLVVVLLAFGFLTAREHRGFAIFFVTDSFGIQYLSAIWCGYLAMVLAYWNSLWKLPEYSFIYGVRLLKLPTRFRWLAVVSAGFLAPAILYGIWIIQVAFSEGVPESSISVILVLFVLLTVLVCFGEWRLRHQDRVVPGKSTRIRLQINRPSSWEFWTVEWLLREKGLTVLICKCGVTLWSVSTMVYYGTDTYDIRLPAIGLSMSVLMNIGLSFEIYQWETKIALWKRSLPVSAYRRWVGLALVHLVVLVPDWLLQIRYGLHLLTYLQFVQLFLLQFAILMAFHSRLYKKDELLEESLGLVFRVFVVLTVVILYQVPLLLIAVALISWSLIGYFRYTR